MKISIKVFFVLVNILALIKCEIFSAITELGDLVPSQAAITKILGNYIRAEEEKITILKSMYETFHLHDTLAKQDTEAYITNPLNAYTLIKRLTRDWQQVLAIIRTNITANYLENAVINANITLPDEEDLNGAARGLLRLMYTYDLDIKALTDGRILNTLTSIELSALECFEIAKSAYLFNDFYGAKLWINQAYSKSQKELNKTVELSQILEYLAFLAHKENDLPRAIELTNELLKEDPNHLRGLTNKGYFKNIYCGTKQRPNTKNYFDPICENSPSQILRCKYQRKNGTFLPTIIDALGGKHIEFNTSTENKTNDFKFKQPDEIYACYNYYKLCRGDLEVSLEMGSKLKCRYLTNHNPFLLIAPFKVEEAHKDPDIILFHEVISDKEIQFVKKLVGSNLKRSHVISGNATERNEIRVSQQIWLTSKNHEIIRKFDRRAEDMTGLNLTTSEAWQLLNYGIGGHYEPHYDYFIERGHCLKRDGNRIATILFYLSDVSYGGCTVFPRLKMRLVPRKGTAVFWYNLHSNGMGDLRTLHASCPTLLGSKWIFNKWIREPGQIFIKPCNLKPPPPDLVDNLTWVPC